MRAVRGRDTRPEMTVRRLVHRMGFRFRLHRKDLPGKPDIVFPKLHKVLFVHGCFWHGHDCPRGSRVPVQNRVYWTQKIARNRERDKTAVSALASLGWKAAVLWECEINSTEQTTRQLRKFLGSAI